MNANCFGVVGMSFLPLLVSDGVKALMGQRSYRRQALSLLSVYWGDGEEKKGLGQIV